MVIKDNLADLENGKVSGSVWHVDDKDKLISDAAQFQVEFKTQAVTFNGQLFISVQGLKSFPIDRLSTDVVDLITKYVKDNMENYVK